MNILHISDLHFGPRHWEGDDNILLEKLNLYDADIVINTGDNTTDGMEDEYAGAEHFLNAIKCKNLFSVIGNHDKRNMRSHELYSDQGYVENEILHVISDKIKELEYDLPLLLIHHSILGTDEEPLKNSKRVIDFVSKHKIENVFCGHTHELDLSRSVDLYRGHTFTQYMCGSLSSCNHTHDDNMFMYYENLGTDNLRVHLVRVFNQDGKVHFEREFI